MNQAEIPMIALAMIRSFGDDAFLKASHRAITARKEGDFHTARCWQRVAEIAHYEQLMATEEPAPAEDTAQAPARWRQWLTNTARDLRINQLLAQRPRPAWQPFGLELDLKKAVDWILGHENAHMHL